MFMKRMCRKPLLPLLLLLVILLGVLFPTVLNQSIEKSYTELDELYAGIVIQCKLIPQTYIGADFALAPEIGDQLSRMDEVFGYYCELNCPYYFRDPGPSSGNSMAYGTNDIYRFAGEHALELCFPVGESIDFSGNDNICVVSEDLLAAASRSIGDTVTVAGSVPTAERDTNAPDLNLTIVGSFRAEDTDIPWNAIIVPKSCFFDTSELLSTAEGIRRWRVYTAFDFTIDQACNKEFDTVKETLQGIVGGKWLLYSTSRELYRAVQPLEKKLQMQEMIFRIVTVLFVFLPALITFLLCTKDKNEVLIRILYGEKPSRVFWSSWAPYTGLVILYGMLALLLSQAMGYLNGWSIVGIAVVSILAAGISIGLLCKTKLVTLYQSREG